MTTQSKPLDPCLSNSIGSGLIPCYVNGQLVNFDPDTGAEANVFGWDDYEAYCRQTGTRPKLKEATRELAHAEEGSMKVKGCFRAKLSSLHNSCIDTIYVLSKATSYNPLLSEQTLLRLGYVRYDLEGAFAQINKCKPVNKLNHAHVHKITEEREKDKEEDDITDEQFQAEIKELMKKYEKVFVGVGQFKPYKISLQLKNDATPFVTRACNVAIHLRAAALERLEYFEKIGIMEKLPPNYPIKFLSPLLVVPKPGKVEVRLVANFKMLNLRLYRTRESPATKLEDFMQKTRGARFYFKLDLKHGYHQLVLDDKSQELCLVATFNGTYKYTRLPMGIVSAGDEFDRAVQATLADCSQTISNRDDILGGSKTRRGMIKELKKVLSALSKAGLTCDPGKTQIGLTQIKFFGMIFDGTGMRPDGDKIAALLNAPRPNNQKSLLSFICSCGWNMTFIPRFAELVSPLRKLAKTKGKFLWEEIHEKSFQELKTALAKDCLNNTYHEDRKTIVYADAGMQSHDKAERGGFSAILVQIDPTSGRPLIIHYASRAISTTEAKWSQVELEARAIRYALDKYRFYLEGHPGFIVKSDCKPLIPLFNKVPIPKSCPPRISKQVIASQDLAYTVEHCPGSQNIADWPSRWPMFDGSDVKDCLKSETLDCNLIKKIYDQRNNDVLTIDIIKKATSSDEKMQCLIQRITNNDFKKYRNDPRIKPYSAIQHELSVIDGIVFHGENLIVPPESVRHGITEAAHKLSHSGETNTEALIRDHFFWPGISNFVKSTLASCQICQNITRASTKAPAGITYTPDQPYQEIAVDFKGPLADGSYCLAFIDLFSRFPDIYFTSTTSFEANKKHFLHYFAKAGKPVSIKSDGGPPFNGYQFADFLKHHGIYHKKIIPGHPESNAEIETFMRSIGKAIKVAEVKKSKGQKSDTREEILAMLLGKRATPHPSTGMSPHEALHGYKMNPGIIQGELPTKKTVGLSRTQRKQIQENIIDSKIKTKLRHDKKKNVCASKIREGDKVLVKLDKKEMPLPDVYTVTRVVRTDVTAISDTGHVVRRHIDNFQLVQDTPGTSVEPQLSITPPEQEQLQQPVNPMVHDHNLGLNQPHMVYRDNPEVMPQQDRPARQPRHVHFNPRVQVRTPRTRSAGPAPSLPNVMQAPLERSAAARAEAERIIQEHLNEQSER